MLQPGDHGSTFAGGPVICAAANAVLDVVEDPAVLRAVARKGDRLAAGLRALGLEVRGLGLMLAFHLDAWSQGWFIAKLALVIGLSAYQGWLGAYGKKLANGVTVEWNHRDAYGLPLPVVRHDYTARDLLARRALLRQAKRVLKRAGARFFYVHGIETFSHAVGTVRIDRPGVSCREAIDPIAIGDIQEIIGRLREKGIGILITDHNVRETLAITDRAYILYGGRILVSGTAMELANNPRAREIYLGENFL